MSYQLKTLFALVFLLQLLQAHLTVSQNLELQLEDAKKFSQKKKVQGSEYNAHRIQISENNRLAAGLENSTVLIYDSNFNVITSMKQKAKATTLVWEGNLLAMACKEGQVLLYDTNSYTKIFETNDEMYEWYPVYALAINKQQTWMAVTNEDFIDMYYYNGTWNMIDYYYQDAWEDVDSVCFSPDGNAMVTTSRTSVEFWVKVDMAWDSVKAIPTSNQGFTHAKFSDNYLAVAMHDETVAIYSIGDWQLISTLTISGAKTHHISFMKNDLMAVGTETGVTIFNVGTWTVFQTLEGNKKVHDVDFSDDKLVITFENGNKGVIGLYDQQSNASYLQLSAMLMIVLSLIFV